MKKIAILILATVTAASANVLVWDHDTGATFTDPDDGTTTRGSQYAVIQALQNNGFSGEVEILTYLPLDISGYDAVFVLCGWWPDDGALTTSQRDRLMAYMDGGKPLYIEGGEIGNRYGDSPLFGYFGAEYVDDGRPMSEGNINEALGANSLDGIDMAYSPYMSEAPDNFIDELRDDDANAEIVMVSKRPGNQSNGRVVWFADPNGSYRVVYSSFIFGGLKDGASGTKDQLMGRYVTHMKIDGSHHTGVESASLGEIKAVFK
ncbi:MAG: hypothetical protein GY771_06025 [bacterium]|nr:hypothetical protein [bacterium]